MIMVIPVVHSHQNLQTGISSLEENPEVGSETLLKRDSMANTLEGAEQEKLQIPTWIRNEKKF